MEEGPRPLCSSYPSYPRSVLQRMLEENHHFQAQSAKIEDERCNDDLMYRLFKRPECVLRRLLDGFIKIATEANAPVYEESAMMRVAIAFLCDDNKASVTIRIFYVLVAIAIEPRAQDVILTGIVDPEKKTAFVKTYLPRLKDMVERLFRSAFSEKTIVDDVSRFVNIAHMTYVTNLAR